jgi:protocatechuate 3,4-dioxygenase beta subunit
MDRRITRRQALGTAGSLGVTYLVARTGIPAALERLGASPAAAATAASCATVTPTMTEGPYWIDELLRRADIRANTASASANAGATQAGVPLTLKINVLDANNGCSVVNGAHVDIWHANAYGLYSDESSQRTGGGTTTTNTKGENFLRGYQVTGQDAGAGSGPVDGQVSFKTIWPGWYTGRAIHIHVRVRTYDSTGAVATNYSTQIFFSDKDNNAVLSGAAPYNKRSPMDDPTTDENDNVLASSADATNIVAVTGSTSAGYAATFTIMLAGAGTGTSSATTASSDTTVDARLRSAKVVRGSNGSRTVVLVLHAGEAVTVRAKLLRGSKVLAHAVGQLTTGSHSLRMAVTAGASAGSATVQLTLADRAGDTRTVRTIVNEPS